MKSSSHSPWVIVVVALALGSGTFSRVASAHEAYCEPAEDIAASIEACPDNSAFVEAANRCHAELEKEVQDVTTALDSQFEANQKKSTSAQVSKEQNQNANLDQSNYQLLRLIALAKRVRRDYYDYLTTIILPGNPSLDLLTAYNIYDTLAGSPCYRDNRSQLEAQMQWIERKIQELEKTRSQVVALDASAATRVENLEQSPGGKILTKAHGKGSGRSPANGQSPRQTSTISGQIKDETLP